MENFKNMPCALLNQLSPATFIAEYWQKKPLLIRQAMPNFRGLLDANDLAGLACEDDVQARIVSVKNNTWQVLQGPFSEDDFSLLAEKDWTLLVQGVNHYLPEAADLLAQFSFIPHARLDDLMVSYAPDGGGVGPHLDSYDVFLLQGSGKRHWKISQQTDLTLLENAPLKILKHFKTEQEWVLEPGDMLYLPPQVAHWGVAVGDDCMTYSIGFRAPKTQELALEFLNYLQANQTQVNGSALYQDPDLSIQAHPAEISAQMVSKVHHMLQNIEWNKDQIADFLGHYLSEPKSHIYFEPNKKISLKQFIDLLGKQPIYLALQTQMLFKQDSFFINGEHARVPLHLVPVMQELADDRQLNASSLNNNELETIAQILHPWYLAGYLTKTL